MPRSGPVTPPGIQVAELRERAQRIRSMAREFPGESDKMLKLAAELDAKAEAMELPIMPDTADP